LGYLDRIPVCVAYEVDGSTTADFPATSKVQRARPVLQTMPGWKADISSAGSLSDLPPEARDYVAFIERECQVPVKWISVGPRREQTFRVE
jgi:adenylosuccinate synthase